jgi:hypothetical protein
MMDGRGHRGARGSHVEASDVKDTDVVCIRAIEKLESQPLDRALVGQ